GWGTLQMGDEDGAEDIMNYGGENLMGATGGFDGDFDDVLLRDTCCVTVARAPSYPTIAGDTSDHTKVSYFSPRFSGFQVGASITPTTGMDGDEFKADGGGFENHIGLGANYDNSFGDLRIRASAVYSGASSTSTGTEDISAWSAGGIVGFGPFSVGANYTDNGDSGSDAGSSDESSYWDVAASFETGPIYLSAGYYASVYDYVGGAQDEFTNIALTADYTVAPGLGVYADITMIDDKEDTGFSPVDQSATTLILGANISF
ncbi:MAG: porin, partial [Proteobacteria bacterium]|nr:porin [Pseudomonadota bacterium]